MTSLDILAKIEPGVPRRKRRAIDDLRNFPQKHGRAWVNADCIRLRATKIVNR